MIDVGRLVKFNNPRHRWFDELLEVVDAGSARDLIRCRNTRTRQEEDIHIYFLSDGADPRGVAERVRTRI